MLNYALLPSSTPPHSQGRQYASLCASLFVGSVVVVRVVVRVVGRRVVIAIVVGSVVFRVVCARAQSLGFAFAHVAVFVVGRAGVQRTNEAGALVVGRPLVADAVQV